MRTMKSILGALMIVALFIPTLGSAQEGNYFTVTTWKLSIPENGTRAELNGLLKEFTEKISFKNDKIISERVLHHISGADLRDLVIISEHASWNDIDAASNMQNELINKAWPKEEDRNAFFKSWNKYVITHSDEIYQENPELTKK
ncbi:MULTISPECIES: hypothetical protein [Arenibacter]|uniref:hypothetical protein n=1 Tax=Arenibacter TaxID=178469 RepID=UPI001C077BB8|nr:MULTISPECIES: hypothetical protein [Arenibacter]MBU2904842.1 hypothetical protein [Arenibacter algicola]MCK0134647.1 hypothetical protein [Arenibacter sp. S6351L]